MQTKRVVVTGMGVISPIGNTLKDYWENLLAGKSGIDYITRFDTSDFDTKFAGEVKDFEPANYMDRKEVRRMDLFTQYAMAAAELAVQDAELSFEGVDRDRTGVIVSSGIGGIETFERQAKILLERGPQRISPFFIPMLIADIAPGYISIRYGLRGSNFATVSACASSSHAIGEAFHTIQRGDADVMICGGAEAAITPLGVGGFNAMKALSTRNDAPQKASRPFDSQRDGFVMGEGAGIVILESEEHAARRGAKMYAEVAGVAYTGDAHHITAPAPEGQGAAKAMRLALQNGHLQPQDIDYINTHGTSTPHGDVAEVQAIKHVFGDHAYQLSINSTKSMVGHLLGASGGVEFIATVLAIRDDVLHPTINQEAPDPACDLDCAANEPRKRPVRAALSNSFGFGGHNVTLALKKLE